MIARAVATLVLTLVPAVASACPSCLSSAYGDRTFNWAFLGLIAMPFVVAASIAGTLLYRHHVLRRSSGGFHASSGSEAARLALSSEPSHRSSRGPHASGDSGAARLGQPREPSHRSPGPHATRSAGGARHALTSEPSYRSSHGPHASGDSGAARLAPPPEERP